jgi:citronellol/citronellal dehydrogenase
MQAVCARGTFLLTKECLPHLLKSKNNARIITISPPLLLDPKHFSKHLAYTMAKYGMSMCTLGWSHEFAGRVAANSMWPRTLIATDALRAIDADKAGEMARRGRTAEIVVDAVRFLMVEPVSFTGNFLIDEPYLKSKGVTDFSKYAVDASQELALDLFVPVVDSKL